MKKEIPNYTQKKRTAFAGALQQAQQAVDAGMAVYNAIDKILWNDWDPIGVRPICAAASDEPARTTGVVRSGGYEDYVPELVMLKLNNASVEKLEEALIRLERSFSYKSDVERCRRVAEKIHQF